MRTRINYAGGRPQQNRMIKDKLNSLKKALLYSYQAGTMVIDNKDYDKDSDDPIKQLPQLEFRCLMNPDKLTFNADQKMLSVPFEDICLNAPKIGKTIEGAVTVPVKAGENFIWKETNSRWLITLQYLEELAYFRADVRKCYPYPIEINGEKYWFSNVGENQQTLDWLRKNKEVLNELNYTRTLYFKRDKNTLDFFKRFKEIKIPNISGELENWQVQAVAPNAIDDIIIVYVQEYFENPFEVISQEAQSEITEQHELNEDFITYAYGKIKYMTPYISGATWSVSNCKGGVIPHIDDAVINEDKINTTVFISLTNAKTGSFDICYNDKVVKHVVVKSI